MDKDELMKIFDYVFNSEKIGLDNQVFSLSSLQEMRKFVRENRTFEFELSQEQQDFLFEIFLESNKGFDEYTPEVILGNLSCIMKAISLDVKSADYIAWNRIPYKEAVDLLHLIANSGYVLSQESSQVLLNDEEVCLASLKNDFHSFSVLSFANYTMLFKKEIFKYLLGKGIEFSEEELKQVPLSYFEDREIFAYYLKKFFVVEEATLGKKEYRKWTNLLYAVFTSKPTIKNFEKIFKYVALEEWREFRLKNTNLYANLLGRICSELKISKNYETAVTGKDFLFEIKDVLKEKYEELDKAMREYFLLNQEDQAEKLSLMQRAKDKMAELLALYVAKSKESFVNDEVEKYRSALKPLFKINQANLYVKKRIVEYRQRRMFDELLLVGNREVKDYYDSILKKYGEKIGERAVQSLILSFLRGFKHIEYLADVQKKPEKFDQYEKYKEILKIVKRLNLGYIQYDSAEVSRYQDVIFYDEEREEYGTKKPRISKKALKEIEQYEELLRINNEIKKEMMMHIKKMEFDGFVDSRQLKDISEELPFTDEFFVFDSEQIVISNVLDTNLVQLFNYMKNIFPFGNDQATSTKENKVDLPYLLNHGKDVLKDNEYYRMLEGLLVGESLAWLVFVQSNTYKELWKTFTKYELDDHGVTNLVRGIPEIIKISNKLNYTILSFNDLMLFNRVIRSSDELELAILGADKVKILSESTSFTDCDERKVIDMATYLVSMMCQRKNSTVPYVKGKTENYRYELYDSQDLDILLSGIKTDACFRLGGTDNDFLFYSALDKNGFVIKFTDNEGNFIARASGFRNGNYVYVNQLRSIYDENGNKYKGHSIAETDEIKEAFRQAAQEMIRISHNNPEEKVKIDEVFVTASYMFKDYEKTVSKVDFDGRPMDAESQDWLDFVSNTKYLDECETYGDFGTDFSEYPLIRIATYYDDKQMRIIQGDNEAIYERVRNPILYGNSRDVDLVSKVYRIAGIKAYLEQSEFHVPVLSDSDTFFVGDNWYLVWNSGSVVQTCVLESDVQAFKECEATIRVLEEQKMRKEEMIVGNEFQINEEQGLKLVKKSRTD